MVLAEAARLERLVGDLLDSARVDSGQFSVRDEVVSLDRVADAVVRRCRRLPTSSRPRSRAPRMPGTVGRRRGVRAARTRTGSSRSLGNLVENALRCTPAGRNGEDRREQLRRRSAWSTHGPGLADGGSKDAFERFYLHRKYLVSGRWASDLVLAIVKRTGRRNGWDRLGLEQPRRRHSPHRRTAAGGWRAGDGR